jgi:putative NADH-flavin reductase
MPSTDKKSLTVGVIGPAGFGGSYLCLELIKRGHHVIGISRHPETLGTHPLYTPRPGNVAELSIEGLAETFRGVDVLVNEYGPHSAGVEALKYSR